MIFSPRKLFVLILVSIRITSLDPGYKSNPPAGWECDVNSIFLRIPDDDPLVTPDVRDRLKKDINNACNAELRREGLVPCDITTFWYNAYHGEQDQERHDHMDGMCPTFLSGIYYNSNPTPTTFFPIATHYRSMRYRGIERSGIRESMYTLIISNHQKDRSFYFHHIWNKKKMQF